VGIPGVRIDALLYFWSNASTAMQTKDLVGLILPREDRTVSMTEDEKRRQQKALLLEYHEAQEHLAHLQERAKRVSAAMDFPAVRGLGVEIQEAERRLRELSERKQSLGLR
jgi:hypothetical protein